MLGFRSSRAEQSFSLMIPIFGVLRVPQNMARHALTPPKKSASFGSAGQPGVRSGIWPRPWWPPASCQPPGQEKVVPTPPNPPKPRGTPGVVKHSSGLPEFWEVPAARPRSGSSDARGRGGKGHWERVGGQSPPKSSPARVTACTCSEGSCLIRNWIFNYKTGE